MDLDSADYSNPDPISIEKITTTTEIPDKINPVIIWAPIVGVIGALLIGFGIFLIIYFRGRRRTDQSDEPFPNYEDAVYEDAVYEDIVYDEAP